MAEQKKQRSRGRAKRTYVHRPNAVCITIHSQDGSAVPRAILNEATEAIVEFARFHNLLINVADT